MAAIDEATALKLATEAHSASTSYFDASIRRQVEQDIRQFQGLHPAGSKYLSEAYRAKSKIFRPKTRSAVRKHEAIAAEAFFSNSDVVNIEPEDGSDPVQQAGAEVMKELLQFRLTKTIPWFLTLQGAYQECNVVGLVCSYQHWVYDKVKKKDEPNVRLVPLENIRFDPGANWMDPVNTSPYFIEMIPMYVKDVRARMTTADPKTGEARWKTLDDATILTAVRGYSDSIRLQRETGRTDPKEQQQAVTAFSIVWVHKNIMEVEGIDYCYYTLGTTALLSKPTPLDDVYWHGERPYVIGYSTIEAHKNYPASATRLARDLQGEINEITNQRLENVKLALNKRYLVARGKQVDLRSITRNVAGSVTLVNDVEKDVKELEFNDVTGSAYKEQEVLNLEFDDAVGGFSNSSVQSNRALNETVGGMELLTTDANQLSGYQLRTFVETWVERVLRQLVLLEQYYETDEVVLRLAGQKAQIYQKFQQEMVTDAMLMTNMTLSVSVGMGATNPQEKINRLMTALRSLNEIANEGALMSYGLKFTEVAKEVFANLGYHDGKRFIDTSADDPRVSQLQQQVQQLQQAMEQKFPPELIDAQVRHINAQILSLIPKNKLALAQSVKTGVEAAYSAMQGAEVVAAVPDVAPVADAIMQASGYETPVPPGVSPGFENTQAGHPVPNLSTQPIKNPHTGTVLALPGMAPPAGQGGPMPGDTTPNTPASPLKPAAPATPGVGERAGIETMGADGVRKLANGGLVDGLSLDEIHDLPLSEMTSAQRQAFDKNMLSQYRQQYPEAFGAPANMGDHILEDFGGGGNISSRFADGGYVSVLERGDMSSPAYRAQLEQREGLQGVYPEQYLVGGGLRSIAQVARGAIDSLAPRLGVRASEVPGGVFQAPSPVLPEGTIGSQVGPLNYHPPAARQSLGDMDEAMAPTAERVGMGIYTDGLPTARNMFDEAQRQHGDQTYQTLPAQPTPGYSQTGYANGGQIIDPRLRMGVQPLGGAVDMANGGQIQGPGTGTSDSIPAVTQGGQRVAVSNQEYVVKPAVVQALGARYFEDLIRKFHRPVNDSSKAPGETGAPQIVLADGSIIIPADVVQALGVSFFEALDQRYGGAK